MAPPDPTSPPASNGCLWTVGITLVLWFAILYLVHKGMT